MSGTIDWLTLILDPVDVPEALWLQIRDHFPNVVQKICTMTGDVEWQIPARESIRSDTHQVTLKCGGRFSIEGSPSRLFDLNNVFGSSDIQECARRMITFAAKQLGVILPMNLKKWRCTRIDYACNYLQGSKAEVNEILRTMALAEACRQGKAIYENGVNFGEGSTLHMGVVYGKGHHLRQLVKKGRAVASPDQLDKADRLIRLEYRMRKKWLDRRASMFGHWSEISERQLVEYHADYFSKFISNYEVADMDHILESVRAVAPTQRQADAAYACYLNIRENGYVKAKAKYTKHTFLRHLRALKKAGLTEANFVQSCVVPITRKSIELGQPVSSWDELLKAV
jgi:II/X family phage/plasmid replication protein